MSILADHQIQRLAEQGMIYPFVPEQIEKLNGVMAISFGLSSFGYDIRLGNTFKVFNNPLKMHRGKIDPKSDKWHKCLTDLQGDTLEIPPNSFALAETIESFKLPRTIAGIVLGKSTYARCGLIMPFTPLEPEWEGKLTVELINSTPLPIVVYANEGIGQVLFFQGEPCAKSYKEKGRSKYQDQKGLTMPKVK